MPSRKNPGKNSSQKNASVQSPRKKRASGPSQEKGAGQANVMAGLCREQPVVSSENGTRYCGKVAGAAERKRHATEDGLRLKEKRLLRTDSRSSRVRKLAMVVLRSKSEGGAARSLRG